MLYVFYGETFWIRQKIKELSLKARKKGCEIFKLEEDSSTPLNSFLARDLFGQKIFLIGERLLEFPEREEEIKALAQDLAESENIVVLVEEKISEAWEKIFTKAGAKIQEFKKLSGAKLLAWLSLKTKEAGINLPAADLSILLSDAGSDPQALLSRLERISLERVRPRAEKNIEEPNYFNFTDLASAKRKYAAITLLRSYVKDGFGAEEAFWKLWWKVKTLRLVDTGKRGTGLHPFVEKKAAADLRNYSREELKKLSYDLLDLFSDARRGEESFEEGLEKILLKS